MRPGDDALLVRIRLVKKEMPKYGYLRMMKHLNQQPDAVQVGWRQVYRVMSDAQLLQSRYQGPPAPPPSRVASGEGLYWLGLFPGADEYCAGGRCGIVATHHATFLLRGHVLSFELCPTHSALVETWVQSHHPDLVTQLVAALRAPPMVRELGYARA